jgi:hypothetical protein
MTSEAVGVGDLRRSLAFDDNSLAENDDSLAFDDSLWRVTLQLVHVPPGRRGWISWSGAARGPAQVVRQGATCALDGGAERRRA